ncbi:MAG TPA: hypothetical protein VLB44_17910 [Kofleriaceae bacterium]|nr:hypothetical protein [Kofleriaceae bacterium]
MSSRRLGESGLVALVIVAGCGTESAGPPTGWQPLITKDWVLAPGQEKTSDLQVDNLEQDFIIGGMRPISPPGTHHTLLYRGLQGTNMIYASGVGTNELVFPEGVGLKLTTGEILGLQLHIFNTSDAELSGTSGIEVLLVDPSTITDEVDMFLPGPRDLQIPPNETTTVTGTCTVNAAQNVFALFPHMHQLGTHLKTEVVTGGTPRVLTDAPYTFEHQEVLRFEPIALAPGDTINTSCTWNNTTSSMVTYGESTTTEMCYSIMYRYPRQDSEFCTN